jgi:MFS family permease
MYWGTNDEQRFSPLNQINEQNIGQLGLLWDREPGSTRGLEATPLVSNGVIYTTGEWSMAYALEAKSGEIEQDFAGHWVCWRVWYLTNRRPQIFYGWWVVATAALGLCLGAAPIIMFAFGVFFKPLGQEFHAGRAAISFAFTLQNLAAAFFAPWTGRLNDRFGARKVILPGTTLL